MIARALSALLVVLCLVGCSSQSGVTGKYKAKMLNASQNDSISKGFVDSTNLDLKPDKTFAMKMMGMPIEGTYESSGETVTLTPTHFQGVMIAEAMKQSKGGTKDLDKPLVLTVSADRKTLTIVNSGTPQADFKFVKTE